jgi:thiol-disulfide isomerase/thioredoxin
MAFSFKIVASLFSSLLFAIAIVHAEDKLIGSQAKDWKLTDWINSPPLALKDLRGKVVLVRWWTGGCPFCKDTAPALNEFHDRYAAKGLVVLGIYHHKSRTPLDNEEVKKLVKDFGFSFPVAVDAGWQTLKRWWLSDSRRKWTSVSFLIDRKGIIRHIHEGGSYVKADKAYQAMQKKIEELLQEK